MCEQIIEDVINNVLIGDAKNNAMEFAHYLRSNEMLFEREKGYWEDKYYWGIKYNDEYVCFILINNEEKTDPESWTVWSDDSGANTFGDSSTDEKTKEIIWEHVIVCNNTERCFDGCKRSRKTILGREFDNVCGTAVKFENPTGVTLEDMKKMIEIRKSDILGG
jgi:hypothetical protein